MQIWRIVTMLFLGSLLLGQIGSGPARADDGFRYFPETDRAVGGIFYIYWQAHGGLAQQGLPLSDEFPEVSTTDHQTYRVQYFERAVFERHPEYQGTDSAVLLSLLGVEEYGRRYGSAGAPDQHPSTDNPRRFPETGQTIGGLFRTYWEAHGGLAQQGYPISNEFTEVSALDGQSRTVQYFQRAVFEYHPEYAGTPYAVLLAQLGTTRYHDRYRTVLVPPLPGHEQFAPRGSAHYLVWAERGPGVPTALRARDLATGQVQEVAAHIQDQNAVALDGSIVVWLDYTNCPPGACRSNAILGKDLATGQTYTVAHGSDYSSDYRSTPAIAGTTVVWSETDLILTADLTTGAVTPLPHAPNTRISTLLISKEYIVWVEIGVGGQSLIRAYNRRPARCRSSRTRKCRPAIPLCWPCPAITWSGSPTI